MIWYVYFNSFYLVHIIQFFSFVCVLTWSLLGIKKSLGHAQIGLLWGFNSKFPTSIPTPFKWGVSPGLYLPLATYWIWALQEDTQSWEALPPLNNSLEIGDEFHYSLKCTHSLLSHMRGIFLESLYSIKSNFTNMSCKALFLYIMSVCDENIINLSASQIENILSSCKSEL